MKRLPLLLTGLSAFLYGTLAQATTAMMLPTSVDEPSILGLVAAGAIAGLLVWRSRRKR